MQKKKSRGNKKELFRKRKSLQSNPKLAEDRPEKPHIRHNPLQLREWQMRMSTKEAGAGEVDTEETDIATDIDADAEEFFQQINDRRTFGSFGAINPLLIQQMGAFGGVCMWQNLSLVPRFSLKEGRELASYPGLPPRLYLKAVEKRAGLPPRLYLKAVEKSRTAVR